MDVKKEIKQLLNQADIYRSQGLLDEAKANYVKAGKLVQSHHKSIANFKNLLQAIAKKLDLVKEDIRIQREEPDHQEMPEKVKEIIKSKFSFAKGEDPDEDVLQGAVALVKFGQYEGAVEEFKRLVAHPKFGPEVAKHMIRCYASLDAPKEAAAQFQQWISKKIFPADELKKLRLLLQDIIDKKGAEITLPQIEEAAEAEPSASLSEPSPVISADSEVPEEDIIDISSVGIPVPDEKSTGSKTMEFDVSFQSGSTVNLLVSERDKKLIESLEPGKVLGQVQFFSPIAMFDGEAIIVSKSKIESGPKAGHYSVDIKIKSI